MNNLISLRLSSRFIVLAYFTISIALSACNSNHDKTSSATQATDTTSSVPNKEMATYQCPMDCEKGKTYDQSGQCPVCNMDLEKIN